MGQAQSIQCAMMQHETAVGRCHMCPLLTNTCLVNLPFEPDGHLVGCVTKKWFCCQQSQPFEEDVSYCLSCLSAIVPTLVQSKTPFSDSPMSCRTLCWPPNCPWLVTFLPQGNVKLYFELLFYSSSYIGWQVGGWQSCGNISELLHQAKCNCSGLRVRAWVCVDIERELGTPVLNPSLIALPRHYSPSLRCVSNVVPQSSVTAGGTTFISSMKDSYTTLSIAPSFLWCTDAHTNTIKATCKHVSIHLRPYWENEDKCVINRFKSSPSA